MAQKPFNGVIKLDIRDSVADSLKLHVGAKTPGADQESKRLHARDGIFSLFLLS
jgi:hypothetical protein